MNKSEPITTSWLKSFIERTPINGAPRLIRLLQDQPTIAVSLDGPGHDISVESVVQWHELGLSPHPMLAPRERGSLMGWRQRDRNTYGSFTMYRPEICQIGHKEVTEEWACDITDVHGLAASKSPLRNFSSTDQMVELNAREMIDEVTHAKLDWNLAHRDIRILHAPGSDFFLRHSWDDRLFLVNMGGSHHFAAAKYIASRLGTPVPLKARLYSHSLNAQAIASLREDFEMFAISNEAPIEQAFLSAMEELRATWLSLTMPRQIQNASAILLPRSQSRSMLVARMLRQAGIVDVGEHLARLASSQRAHDLQAERLGSPSRLHEN